METTELEAHQNRLQGRIAQICGHLNVLHAELVALTAESVATKAWCGEGIQSPQHWVAWQTGVSPERAKQIVHVAQRCSELPVTFAAFGEGALSIDQMAAVAKRTPAFNDAEACELAKNATVAQLRVGLSKHFFPPEPTPDEQAGDQPDDQAAAPTTAPPHRLSTGFNDDGDFFIHGAADSADGAIIDRALCEAKDALFRAGDTDATWLDALLEVCRRSIGAVTTPSRRDTYKVIFHVDSNGAWVHQGPVVPPSLFERICCDGLVQPLWHTDGSPINMGRRRHIVPLRTRIVVEDRDAICRHPSCTSSQGLEVHHILHWIRGGVTDTHNLCCLCGAHHDAHHRGEFTIEGNADDPNGLIFRGAHGQMIQPCAKPEPPGTKPPPAPTTPYVHPSGETLQTKWLSFSQPPPRQPPSPPRRIG